MTLLQYPYLSPTNSLQLPNPVFGNVEAIRLRQIIKHAMDFTPYIYKKSPRLYRLVFSYTLFLCETSWKNQIKTFLRTSMGSDIKLTDHNSNIWKVKCVSNPIQFQQPNRNVTSVTLEFEGVQE